MKPARWPPSASKPRSGASGASVSTATATTATASTLPRSSAPPRGASYVGRFAPSPTGSLHLGSLVAALGSFLDARKHGGVWLVRIEDLDRARELPGCAGQILRTLERLGLEWDGTVEYQNARRAHYSDALAKLITQGLTFECSCSRRERLAEAGYPGTCRNGPRRRGPTATRFRVDEEGLVAFEDRVQGSTAFRLGERGDVIVRRRDGTFAYQLAVVVDDALQGITDVVRGADLLDSTPWQIALQRALALPTPRYAHLPLVLEPGGRKLAKSRRSVALDARTPALELCTALGLLRQQYPAELKLESPRAVLDWACKHWDPGRFAGVREICAPP